MSARVFTNPYTGVVMNYDSVPDHNPINQKPGKWCHATNMPLNKLALDNFDFKAFGLEGSTDALKADLTAKVAAIEKEIAA